MTMQECYKAIGGNYEAVLGRLHSEALIQRFTLKFLEDQSYLQLKQALENKNYEDAFRSAHTLKGVCQNLSGIPSSHKVLFHFPANILIQLLTLLHQTHSINPPLQAVHFLLR